MQISCAGMSQNNVKFSVYKIFSALILRVIEFLVSRIFYHQLKVTIVHILIKSFLDSTVINVSDKKHCT